MFRRSKDDNRSASEVVRDVSHDIYHVAAKFDKGNPDGNKRYDSCVTNDCEWKRAND
jgi:hypothetical protein